MRQREGLARTLRIEHITAVAAVVFAVHEAKSCPTSHADVRIYPLWWLPWELANLTDHTSKTAQ